jgi:hypothetical protein
VHVALRRGWGLGPGGWLELGAPVQDPDWLPFRPRTAPSSPYLRVGAQLVLRWSPGPRS